MPTNSESDETTDTNIATEQALELQLAITRLRRRAQDLSDRLYRELRPYGVFF